MSEVASRDTKQYSAPNSYILRKENVYNTVSYDRAPKREGNPYSYYYETGKAAFE